MLCGVESSDLGLFAAFGVFLLTIGVSSLVEIESEIGDLDCLGDSRNLFTGVGAKGSQVSSISMYLEFTITEDVL